MPDFSYIARDAGGQKLTGVLSAATRGEALAQLGQKGVFPLQVEQARRGGARRGSRVKPQLMAVFYNQLAGLLRSGVPLLRSLAVLKEQTSSPVLGEVLEQVHRQVEEGATLAEALGRHPGAFGEMAVNMVRAGGEGGFLEDALTRVADFTEKQEDLKSRTQGALAYPVLLAVMGTLIVSGLLIFVVPRFETLFQQLRDRGELPWVTQALLWFSGALASYGIFIVAALVAAGMWGRKYLATEEGRQTRDRLILKLPLMGKVFLSLAVSRFCRILGTLLKNGVPILKSLEISSAGAGNRVLASAIQGAAQNISEGQSLTGPLAASGHFPRTVVEMIAVAEESNNLDTVLTDLSDDLDRQTWRQLDLMVRLIEPIMLLLLAGVVLAVVVALLVPVLKMSMTI